ncbi:MAG TPA: SMP-30/gluconolactonase/LRE family protein [Isosphaeraceae bacterium]|jgi:gluconolactonase|nr:SMP-30/gluconolactonase/LRE family protein [Isosphaeraceae bacterium]
MRTTTRPWIGLAVVLGMIAPARGQEATKKPYPTFGSIERKDAKLDALIPKDAKIEKLAEGFDWSEGPVWLRDRGNNSPAGALLFSDVPKNTVYIWRESQGVREYLKPSGYTGKVPRGGEPGSNGLVIDDFGRLVLCQHGDRRVARLADNNTFVTLADRYDGKRLNSPNDATYNAKGDLYFTDPPYGLLKLNDDPAKELPFNGVYRLDREGKLTLLTREMTFPNGIAFSPDEKTLYVANSDPKKAIWMAFPVKDDGTIGTGRVFADVTKLVEAGKKGLPDGMKVDRAGNLFATGPGGVLVFAPDGTHLGTLDTGEATANCNFGGDGSDLYITADMYIGRVKTTTKGKGF